MELVNKIMSNGSIVGYTIDEGMGVTPAPIQYLYTELILPELHASGYKIYDHNGTIDLPNGDSAESLPPIELGTVDMNAWAMCTSTAMMSAMNDVECSKYYSFKQNTATIDVRKEDSYEINTREEFEKFIAKTQYMISSYGFSDDNRPVNSFVRPEALYTVDELLDDITGTVANNLRILNYRHVFRNYNAYRTTVKFLKDKGVLDTSNAITPGEFMRAYYTWGPDGLTGNLVDLKFRQGVDGQFNSPDDKLATPEKPDDFVCSNRDRVPCLFDLDSNMSFLTDKLNIRDIIEVGDFGRKPLAIGSPDTLLMIKRADHKGFKYITAYGLKNDVSDRLYFTYVASNGFKYIYKVAPDKSMFILSSSRDAKLFNYTNFGISTLVGHLTISLDQCPNESAYILWNICINSAAEKIKEKTRTAPVSSSYELLTNIGMSPLSAVKYMANHVIRDHSYECNKELKEQFEGLDVNCVDFYYKPLPNFVLDAFMIKEEDVEGVRSFLDIADVDDLLDRRDAMLRGELTAGMPGYDNSFTLDRGPLSPPDALEYYNNLKFVYDAINGDISVDAFGDGLRKDAASSSMIAAQVIMSIVYSELGNNPDLEQAAELVNNITSYNLINIDDVFRTRDNAYKGYIIDNAVARANKANIENSNQWGYITKIFRELSNKPKEEARPYLLEMLAIDNGKDDMIYRRAIREAAENAIKTSEAISDEYIYEPGTKGQIHAGKTYRDIALMMVDEVASQLFFTCIGKKNPDVDANGNCVFNIRVDEETKIPIPVDPEVVNLCKQLMEDRENHIKYITVFDFNEWEFNSLSGTFVFNVVNACVGPWFIVPKKGYSIKTYGLLPSYYEDDLLEQKFGRDWLMVQRENKNVIQEPLQRVLSYQFIPTIDAGLMIELKKELDEMQDYEDFESVLTNAESIETPAFYTMRWAILSRAAKRDGHMVYHMPLKQDIVYNSLCELFTGEPAQDVPEIVLGTNHALEDVDTEVIKYDTTKKLITVNTDSVKFKLTKVMAGDISTLMLLDVYRQLVLGNKYVVKSGSWIVANETVRYCVPIMSDVEAQRLFQNHAITFGKDNYVLAVDGIYKIGEV